MASSPISALILAAGIGSRIRPLTDDRPKSLLEIEGISLLRRMTGNLRACGIERIILVVGYLQEQIREHMEEYFPDLEVQYIFNEHYATTNTAYSLHLAEEALAGQAFVKFDADVVFEASILERLVKLPGNVICLDTRIHLADEEVKAIVDQTGQVLKIGKEVAPSRAAGESIGIEKINARGSERLFEELATLISQDPYSNEYYEKAYEQLIESGSRFQALDITGSDWTEIDTHDDFVVAQDIFRRREICLENP